MPHAALDDLRICYETAGPPGGPAVLLIMGLGAQMIAWPHDLIDPLAEAGARVIWFDNRDVGESTWFDHVPAAGLAEVLGSLQSGSPLPPAYTLSDMAGDAVALLDHLGVGAAHVVGASMGGMVAQRMAIDHPDRVASLTSVMSTTGAADLPGPTPEATEALLSPAPVDDRAAYVEAMMAKRRILGSPGLEADEEWVRATIERGHERGLNPDGFLRQYHAILVDGDRTGALAELDVPALVVHGADDPLVRVESGRATAAAIPRARLEVIEGMGHDLPPTACARLVELLLPMIRS